VCTASTTTAHASAHPGKPYSRSRSSRSVRKVATISSSRSARYHPGSTGRSSRYLRSNLVIPILSLVSAGIRVPAAVDLLAVALGQPVGDEAIERRLSATS
jgi:hypothetical protein